MNNNSNLIKRPKKSNLSECKICGSPASYSYFGVISCSSCKIFFRRNAEHGQKLLKCHFNNNCEINLNTRHTCASCRLVKCFNQGMQVKMIRHVSIKNKNSTSKTIVKLNQPEYLPTINLLEKDNSTFDNDQWTLLSNIIHSYDDSKLFLIAKLLKNDNQLNRSLTTLNKSIVQELVTNFYDITGICLRLNKDITHLSSNDRSILLHTAANNVTCLGANFILHHSNLINDEIFWKYLKDSYGKLIMDIHHWSAKFTELDITLFKLGIALFTFSINSRIFYKNILNEYTSINQILNIQNKYTELTWKYLIYKYGYYQSIKKFLHLIQWFLSVTVFISYTHTASTYVHDIESLIERTELAFILDDDNRIIETKN